MTTVKRITDPHVLSAFNAFPKEIKAELLKLRAIILKVASETPGVGPLDESLKWGEPAYSTNVTKTGSPIRLGWKAKNPSQFAVYFICTTNLIESFRAAFGDDFRFEKNRAIVFNLGQAVPEAELSLCIRAALTYHKRVAS